MLSVKALVYLTPAVVFKGNIDAIARQTILNPKVFVIAYEATQYIITQEVYITIIVNIYYCWNISWVVVGIGWAARSPIIGIEKVFVECEAQLIACVVITFICRKTSYTLVKEVRNIITVIIS